MSEKQFRFQDMQIWQRGAAISRSLSALADTVINGGISVLLGNCVPRR
jgi:hypothetical protein